MAEEAQAGTNQSNNTEAETVEVDTSLMGASQNEHNTAEANKRGNNAELPSGQNGSTDQKSVISWATIQQREDYLSSFNWFNPNAFYPTVFGFAEGENALNTITLMQGLTARINYNIDSQQPYDPAITDKTEEQTFNRGINASNKNNVTSATSVYWAVYGTGKEDDYSEFAIKSKLDFKLNENALATLISVEGLEFPEMPFSRKNGMLCASGIEDKGSQITIKFLLTDYMQIMSFVHRWQSEWWQYNFKRRAIRQHGKNPVSVVNGKKVVGKYEDNSSGEGYLGMDYIHIFPDGTIDRIGHLFLMGLIPIKVSIDGFTVGPGASAKSDIPILSIRCIYSQAYLGIGASPDPGGKARWYSFK